MRKAAQRAENGKVSGFMLCQWKCPSHLNIVVVWLHFSFLGERLTLFKLAYNRSHKFHSGDSKLSFYAKLLFVKEKDFIILSWSYFACRSQAVSVTEAVQNQLVRDLKFFKHVFFFFFFF